MSKVRVQLHNQGGYAEMERGATVGATIGTDLYNADGSLFDPSYLSSSAGTTVINGVAYSHVKDATTARAITAADDKKIIEFTASGAIAITVSGLIPFSQGFDCIVFCSASGAQATFSGTNGMTITSSDSLKTRTRYSAVGLMVEDVNQAVLYGDIEPVAPAVSALVRSAGSAGAPVWLSYTSDGQVIVRRGGALVAGALAGSEVSNTPAGSIAATTVQAAINELDAEKAPLSHTHTASAITDFAEAVDDRVAALLVAGTNVSLTYNDASNTLTIDASGGGGGGGGNFVEAEVDFGSGKSDATVVITGQAGILTTSKVNAWIFPKATTDHTADEHWLETISVHAGNIVAGTGFTIYAKNTNTLNEPVEAYNRGGKGGKGTLLYGKYTVQASWG